MTYTKIVRSKYSVNKIFDGQMKELEKQSDEVKKNFLDGSVNVKVYARKYSEAKRDYYMLEMMKKNNKDKK